MFSPSKRQLASGTYEVIGGIWHKRCSGPAHDKPTYLPATEKYFHRRKSGPREGELVSRCRLCINWDKLKSPGSEQGYLSITQVRHYYEEATNRIGVGELARRAGISEGHIQLVLRGQQTYVRKSTFRKVLLELVSIRRKGEHSIAPGARWRNERRIHRNQDICPGCGTPKGNFTKGCKQCKDRLDGMLRHGHISRKEWNELNPV